MYVFLPHLTSYGLMYRVVPFPRKSGIAMVVASASSSSVILFHHRSSSFIIDPVQTLSPSLPPFRQQTAQASADGVRTHRRKSSEAGWKGNNSHVRTYSTVRTQYSTVTCVLVWNLQVRYAEVCFAAALGAMRMSGTVQHCTVRYWTLYTYLT